MNLFPFFMTRGDYNCRIININVKLISSLSVFSSPFTKDTKEPKCGGSAKKDKEKDKITDKDLKDCKSVTSGTTCDMESVKSSKYRLFRTVSKLLFKNPLVLISNKSFFHHPNLSSALSAKEIKVPFHQRFHIQTERGTLSIPPTCGS